MKLYHYTSEHTDPFQVFSKLHALPYSLYFDSADESHALSRYSFITWCPLETIEAKNGKVTITNKSQQKSFTSEVFTALKERLEHYNLDMQHPHNLPPFQGGAAGFFGYDLARGIEELPEKNPDNKDMPDMAVGIYDQVYVFDHEENRAMVMVWAQDETKARDKLENFDNIMACESAPLTNQPPFTPQWRASNSRKEYENLVQKVIDYIYEGDIFQANLSQRFDLDLPQKFSAFAHYAALREINAAPFSAYMNFGSFQIVSTSPERFLKVRDRQVETRPVKGTRPRGMNKNEDAALKNELKCSKKDTAENIIIVDLLRNDISRVCEDHSVNVPTLCGLESFSGVHHLVSTITGTLRADQSPTDLLRACFPGGSITGAPKIRAMEIIEELEKHRRGPYCGSMGYIGFNGQMDTNIAIRTLVYEGSKVSFHSGGGITADSVPADEYEETMTKAGKIFDSFYRSADQRKAADAL